MIFTSFNPQGMRKFHWRGKGHVANLAASSNGSQPQLEIGFDLMVTGEKGRSSQHWSEKKNLLIYLKRRMTQSLK